MNEVEGAEDQNVDRETDDAYERAKARALAMLKQGFHMGGGPYPSRDSLHERRPQEPSDPNSEAPDDSAK